MPNWLGDFVMAFPHLRAIKERQPEARLTLIAKPQFKELIELFPLADEFVALPHGTMSRFCQLRAMGRSAKPECHVLFTNSMRGDLEAWFVGAKSRLGMAYPGRRRPLLTGVYRLDSFKDELHAVHQTTLWERFLKSIDLIDTLDGKPFPLGSTTRAKTKIGIIAGSSNNPKKCWTVENWCGLIRELSRKNSDCEFVLFGTPNDREISDMIVNGCDIPLQDMTGKTDLRQLALELAGCRVVIGNDTGGMHLANAVGTPVAVLFGPTNPSVTAPFFDVPKVCIQPEGCPPEGGRSIRSLSSDEVAARLLDFLERGLVTGKV